MASKSSRKKRPTVAKIRDTSKHDSVEARVKLGNEQNPIDYASGALGHGYEHIVLGELQDHLDLIEARAEKALSDARASYETLREVYVMLTKIDPARKNPVSWVMGVGFVRPIREGEEDVNCNGLKVLGGPTV